MYYLHCIVPVVSLLADQWRGPTNLQDRMFELPKSEVFTKYYDKMQENLQAVFSMDKLLAGVHEGDIEGGEKGERAKRGKEAYGGRERL